MRCRVKGEECPAAPTERGLKGLRPLSELGIGFDADFCGIKADVLVFFANPNSDDEFENHPEHEAGDEGEDADKTNTV